MRPYLPVLLLVVALVPACDAPQTKKPAAPEAPVRPRTGPRTADQLGAFDPATREFTLKGEPALAFHFGPEGVVPITGDWDGDGDDTVGVYDPLTGSFYINNTNRDGNAELSFQFGRPGLAPIAGDWDGDGKDTVGVHDSLTGSFYLTNALAEGVAHTAFPFGEPGTAAIAGDWNGDGVDTVGVYEAATGNFYLTNSNKAGVADLGFPYGPAGVVPVIGDWDGDGTDGIGIYDNGTFKVRDALTAGPANREVVFGKRSDTPLAGRWGAP